MRCFCIMGVLWSTALYQFGHAVLPPEYPLQHSAPLLSEHTLQSVLGRRSKGSGGQTCQLTPEAIRPRYYSVGAAPKGNEASRFQFLQMASQRPAGDASGGADLPRRSQASVERAKDFDSVRMCECGGQSKDSFDRPALSLECCLQCRDQARSGTFVGNRAGLIFDAAAFTRCLQQSTRLQGPEVLAGDRQRVIEATGDGGNALARAFEQQAEHFQARAVGENPASAPQGRLQRNRG